MAAVAIPIVVLGSLYILSEQEKRKENFSEEIQDKRQKNQFLTGEVKEAFSNYETRKMEDLKQQTDESVNSYANSNQHTDKFFVENKNSNVKENKGVNLMSGENVDVSTFKHNNMQPYFGAKIRGSTGNYNNTESFLDMKQGYGSQVFSKSEQAPLFKPDNNVNLAHGTANNSDFFQSRMNESMKMNNVTLWEQQRVGPGLGLGYGNQDERGFNTGGVEGNAGFNAGMTGRENWMPKSVDDLRVDTNPKQSFDLNGHQGPAISAIKIQGPNEKIGKVEKHLPEKSYEAGPERFLITTGVQKAQPIRSTQVIPMENRIDTTREYYGGGSNTLGQATYTQLEYEECKKQNLGGLPVSNASAKQQNFAGENDFAVKGYNILANNRTTDKDNAGMGGIFGAARAVVAPLLDILNPTRKENVIGNLRQSGNVNGGARTGHMFNEYDKTKVTNREMQVTKQGMNFVNVQGQGNRRGNNDVAQYQPVQNQRDTTNSEYIGNGSAQGTGLRPYNAAYEQHNNVNKTYESRPNQGGMSLLNSDTNMTINRDDNIFKNSRQAAPSGGPSLIPSQEFMGEVNGLPTYDMSYDSNRLDPGLLSAFKSNPYTKSLTSVA